MDTIALFFFSVLVCVVFLTAFGAGAAISFGSGFGLGAVIVLNELRAH